MVGGTTLNETRLVCAEEAMRLLLASGATTQAEAAEAIALSEILDERAVYNPDWKPGELKWTFPERPSLAPVPPSQVSRVE